LKVLKVRAPNKFGAGNITTRPQMATGAGAGSVAALFEECSASARSWSRTAIDRLRLVLALHLTFRGKVFQALSVRPLGSTLSGPELAARYQALVESFRKTQHPDDRLNLFAQWLWAELGIAPDEVLGTKEAQRLTVEARARLRGIPFNDLYYAELVQIWLVYSERLFLDARAANTRKPETHLQTLCYEPSAIELFTSKRWRSPVEFTCEWLGARAGIKTVKARKDADLARTLRNAYTKIFGRGAPHLLPR
jgi:hypothetical protein